MGQTAADDPWRGANPLDPAFKDDPHTPLRRLREVDPVNLTPLGYWRLSRYDDVHRLLHRAPAGVRRADGTLPGVDESEHGPRNFILMQDPPNHTRLRKLVSSAFTPRAICALRPSIERVVDRCLSAVAARGEMDVIADLALPVPSTLICEMMGVPADDRAKFARWTAEATHALATFTSPPEVLERARNSGMALAIYFEDLIAERRERLGDDILSGLLRAEAEGDRLNHGELLSQAIGLLIAGFETTIGLIGNGVRTLIRHPEELAKLRDDPTLIGSAVEECLRFEGPIVGTVRVLHADVEFGGKTIPKDATVFALLAAANRDPDVFPEPDRFDVTRQPNEHLAFGGGAHFCLGSHLARLEGEIAIGELLRRFDDLRLVSERVEWGPSLFRVPGRLPITFKAR
ncbi:MAG TPA: cytochrome P450 [Candidatus Limnocylindria bacterium]|nr:cytochrome P450 [Candidatus Limnocylindria bacterium]